jgi:hypothetical protein
MTQTKKINSERFIKVARNNFSVSLIRVLNRVVLSSSYSTISYSVSHAFVAHSNCLNGLNNKQFDVLSWPKIAST